MKPRASRYSPRLLDADVLERLTVGREAVLDKLVTNLRSTIDSGQGRFDLLVGSRGVGKSHMLGLVEAWIRSEATLQGRVLVVSLSEEFHPSSLLHLLAKVLGQLPEDESLPPLSAQLAALRTPDRDEAIEMAVAMIRGRLRGRALLVMLENLDFVFRDLGRKAQAKLRKIVQTEHSWSIFATARTAAGLMKQADPFFGTFVIEPLEPLAPEQCREMMIRLARAYERPKLEAWLGTPEGMLHVRAAHHLVGGNPRVVAMVFHHLDPERLDDVHANFYRLAEEVTPYYQEQMTRLSAGQRPVMEFLAERWSPASVSEIAAGTFNEPASVSNHLRALRRDRLVHSLAVGKERFYELSDPLHRIARAMKRDDRLGAAIAQVARMWALLSATRLEAGGDSRWAVRLCEDDSEYLQELSKQLLPALGTGGDELAQHVDALLRYTEAHRFPLTILGLMRLGREQDAVVHIKTMLEGGMEDHVAVLYAVWLELGFQLSWDSPSRRLLVEAFEGVAPHKTMSRVLGVHGPSMRGLILLRALEDLGIDFVIEVLRGTHYEISEMDWVRLAFAAWVRKKLGRFLAATASSPLAVELLGGKDAERYSSDLTDNPELIAEHFMFALVQICYSLDQIAAFERPDLIKENLDALALENLGTTLWIGIPLWVASGRDPAKLSAVFESYVAIPVDLEGVLEVADNARAFASLGLESRVFVRMLFESIGASDLLAQLPADPSSD